MVVAARITHALKAVAVVLRVVTDCTELACAEALLLAANDGVNIPGWAALRDRARWDGGRSADRSADGKDAYELAHEMPRWLWSVSPFLIESPASRDPSQHVSFAHRFSRGCF